MRLGDSGSEKFRYFGLSMVFRCDAEQEEYRQLLAPFEVHFVGLFAPLSVLEARERERGDRLIGLARWQYDRVHSGMMYDLRIDAAVSSPLACAQQIKAALRL